MGELIMAGDVFSDIPSATLGDMLRDAVGDVPPVDASWRRREERPIGVTARVRLLFAHELFTVTADAAVAVTLPRLSSVTVMLTV